MQDKEIILDIDGLTCGHCAESIQEKLDTIDYIQKATLNFLNKTLKIELKAGVDKDERLKDIAKIINKIEANVVITERSNSNIMLDIAGLSCGHCAEVIEDKLNTIDYINKASLNFLNKTLSISFNKKINKKEEIQKINEIISKIDKNVSVAQKIKNSAMVEEKDNTKFRIIKLAMGTIFLILAGIINNSNVSMVLYTISYITLGYDVITKALKNITRGRIFDENFLMSIATIGAFYIGEFAEGVAVMLFYQIGEFFQEKAVGKSRNAIKSLVGIKAEYATLENGERVSPEDVNIGDIILIKAGEKVPLDSVVVEGSSFLDMSALIGESVPRKVKIGDDALSGSINNTSVLKAKVTKEYENSTVAKVLELVESSTAKKSKVESFISQFAKIYTPIVVIIAFILAIVPPIIFGGDISPWIEKSIVFLVSSCPCALVISIPLSLFSGIGSASKRGILIKGSTYVQSLSELDTIVFDKTGTLTKGVFEISKISPTKNIDENYILKTIYHIEKLSIHPVAKSIVSYCDTNIKDIGNIDIKELEELSGLGIVGKMDNELILAGNEKLMQKYSIPFDKCTDIGTVVYVAKNGEYLGYIVVSDIIKDESKTVIQKLKDVGIKNTVMLSGDREEVANYVASEIGLDKYYAELLPQNKVEHFEEMTKAENRKKIAFVGDGINDTPVLAISDVGFAMGAVGSDAAIEAADVVIMNDDLNKISESIIISKNTMKIVKINTILSIGIKFVVLALALMGYENIWLAIFADVGVTVIAILNAMRRKI